MALPDPHPLSGVLAKYLSSCARMVVDAQDERPLLFLPVLFPYLEFFCGCLTQTAARLPDPLVVFALVFVRCVIECQQYQAPEQAHIAAQLSAFFSDQLVLQITERLFSQYLRLTKDDLDVRLTYSHHSHLIPHSQYTPTQTVVHLQTSTRHR